MNAPRNNFRDLLERRRAINGLLALACALLMAYALYSQYVLDLEPCPLCVFQRIAMIGTGLFFLLAWLHGPGNAGARVYGTLAGLAALAGAGVAARHVWLQNLPAEEVPACGPGLDYMLDVFPLAEALRMVFTGSGECADIDWQFLGLSMPAWVLVWFVFLGLAALIINFPARIGTETAPSAK